jgi:hypothetical protein
MTSSTTIQLTWATPFAKNLIDAVKETTAKITAKAATQADRSSAPGPFGIPRKTERGTRMIKRRRTIASATLTRVSMPPDAIPNCPQTQDEKSGRTEVLSPYKKYLTCLISLSGGRVV